MIKETQYEDAPIDSLYPHQKYFASKEKNKQVAPEVGGTAAVIAGSPIIAGKAIYSGGKSGLSAMGNNIASTLLEKMGELNKKAPSASFGSPIVQQPPAPYSVWNEKLAGNAAPGSQMEKASLLKNQEMMRTIGPGGELAGGNIYKGSILLGPNDLPITKPPPAPPPLSMTEKLVQTVKGIPGMETAGKIMRNPLMKGAGELGALWEGGENSVRLYNHFKNSEYGRSLLDAAGLLSNAAMLAPLPTSPESNIIGGALSIPIGYLQGKLDESDLPKKKAGGLMSLAEGRQPGKPDESLVPQVTLEGDYNYRPDLDPEVSLEQTIKDMYNSPANSLSPILHPESVIKGLGSAGESLGRGAVTAIPGVFGDLESLGRGGLNYIGTGRDVNNDVQYDELGNPISNNTSYGESTNLVNPHTALPTTEDYLKMLPRATPKFGDDTANSFLEGLGGFLSPLAFEKASPYALKGAKALGQTAAEKMMSGEPWVKGAEFLNPPVLPITAWHGTPHKIEGGFDLAKVGTGEGNQTFGHGMYFGQERKTGEEYQRRLSEKLNKNTVVYKGDDGYYVKNGLGSEGKNIAGPFKKSDEAETIRKGLETKGNLYKVDIPDEQIPKMLDLDKPISEQMHVWEALHPDVRKAIDDLMETKFRNPISEVPEAYTGQNLYGALSHHDVGEVLPPELPNSNWFKGDTSYEKHASQYLNSLGIPGIKYLDQGSRGNAPIVRKVNVLNPETNTYTKEQYEVDPRWHEPNKKYYFPTEEEAKTHADSYGTRNFVSFDPTTVKILEENDIPLDILKGKN